MIADSRVGESFFETMEKNENLNLLYFSEKISKYF